MFEIIKNLCLAFVLLIIWLLIIIITAISTLVIFACMVLLVLKWAGVAPVSAWEWWDIYVPIIISFAAYGIQALGLYLWDVFDKRKEFRSR